MRLAVLKRFGERTPKRFRRPAGDSAPYLFVTINFTFQISCQDYITGCQLEPLDHPNSFEEERSKMR